MTWTDSPRGVLMLIANVAVALALALASVATSRLVTGVVASRITQRSAADVLVRAARQHFGLRETEVTGLFGPASFAYGDPTASKLDYVFTAPDGVSLQVVRLQFDERGRLASVLRPETTQAVSRSGMMAPASLR